MQRKEAVERGIGYVEVAANPCGQIRTNHGNRAKQVNKYGYLNTKGKVVLPFVYDDADDFNDSKKAMVKYKGKWGMIDNLGNIIIPFEYEQAEPYTKSNEEWEDYYYILIKKGREVNIDKEGNLLSFK